MCSGQSQHSTKATKHTTLFEKLPAALPVDACRRLPNPDRIVIDDAPCREDDGEGIDNQRGVEILKIARPEDNSRNQNARPQRCPSACSNPVSSADYFGRK